MARTTARRGSIVALAALMLAAPLGGQSPSNPEVAYSGPVVGEPAPDFTLSGATRYGLLRQPVRLADLRGQTVVLAFFYKARTKG